MQTLKGHSTFAEKILGSPLVPSDSHDEEGALMTNQGEWYFVPHHDDCVRGRPTIAEPGGHLTDRPRWGLEAGKWSGGSYWEPPDFDLVEIDRFDSLEKAIAGAAHYLLDQKLNDEALAILHSEMPEEETY